MNIEKLREFCLSLGDVTEKIPFGKFARRYESLLVFYVRGHMFCMADMDHFTTVEVRSTPDEMAALEDSYTSTGRPVNPAMKFWISLELGGDITDSKVLELVRRAHAIVADKYKKK